MEIINIELPDYLSKQYMYRITTGLGNLKELDPSTYSFTHPIHFRYPTPQKADYAEINIHPIERVWIECKNNIKV